MCGVGVLFCEFVVVYGVSGLIVWVSGFDFDLCCDEFYFVYGELFVFGGFGWVVICIDGDVLVCLECLLE